MKVGAKWPPSSPPLPPSRCADINKSGDLIFCWGNGGFEGFHMEHLKIESELISDG